MGKHAYPPDGPRKEEMRATNHDENVDRMSPTIRPIRDGDRVWIRGFVRERWGDEIVVAHGVVYRPDTLPGFVLIDEIGEVVGLLTYRVDGDTCEVVTIDAVVEGRGFGSALLDAVSRAAIDAGCARLWLITTNDNERAISFYRARGFEIVAIREGAIERSRELKPSIPLLNDRGVPIRDEIEMERLLASDQNGNLV
jgi:ribosomal protein S18 acetylase RimI-like enzyme